jgi:streptomycin 6-kinase
VKDDDSTDEVELAIVDDLIAPRSPSPPPPSTVIHTAPSALSRSAAVRNASKLAAEIKQQQLLDLSSTSDHMSTSVSELPVFTSPEREWTLRVIMPNGQISRFHHDPVRNVTMYY